MCQQLNCFIADQECMGFLLEHQITLVHDITYPPQMENDAVILIEFHKHGAMVEELLTLNQCQLFLNAYYVSNLAEGAGLTLLEEAWTGRKSTMQNPQNTWPIQGNPTRSACESWRAFVKKCCLGRGLQIKRPLGNWLVMDLWRWYYAPSDNRLNQQMQDGRTVYLRLPHPARRPMFQKPGLLTSTFPKLSRAAVYERGDRWVC